MVLGHGNHTSTQILEELSLRSSGQIRISTRDAAALMMTTFKGSPRVLDGMLLGPHRALECDSKADSDPMVRTRHGTACRRSVAGGRDAESRPARAVPSVNHLSANLGGRVHCVQDGLGRGQTRRWRPVPRRIQALVCGGAEEDPDWIAPAIAHEVPSLTIFSAPPATCSSPYPTWHSSSAISPS